LPTSRTVARSTIDARARSRTGFGRRLAVEASPGRLGVRRTSSDATLSVSPPVVAQPGRVGRRRLPQALRGGANGPGGADDAEVGPPRWLEFAPGFLTRGAASEDIESAPAPTRKEAAPRRETSRSTARTPAVRTTTPPSAQRQVATTSPVVSPPVRNGAVGRGAAKIRSIARQLTAPQPAETNPAHEKPVPRTPAQTGHEKAAREETR
jgi:hypothetical protein